MEDHELSSVQACLAAQHGKIEEQLAAMSHGCDRLEGFRRELDAIPPTEEDGDDD